MASCASRLIATAACEAPTASIGAAALLEAGRAVHRLIRTRLERHAGDVAAARADCLVHLSRGAGCAAVVTATGGIRPAITLSSPRSAAIRAASRLAESTAGIEILLAGGKGKTLATIAAGQSHVARHVVDGSLKTNRYVRSARLARARSPVGWVPSTQDFTDEEQRQPPQFSGSPRPRAIRKF
jgi:hypothetical protein